MRIPGKMGGLKKVGLIVGALALVVLAGCSTGGSTTNPSGSSGGNAPGKAANTVTFADPPNTVPNWIWPFSPIANFSLTNSSELQLPMYRPLYWFGDEQGSPAVNDQLSIGNAPTFSNNGKTVTVTLKPYVWNNGEQVTSQDVVFWFNMEKAEKANWAGYVPGQFPDNVTSITTPNATTVVFNTDKAYSEQWFEYNQLAQITPMPMAWDMTSATQKGTCATDEAACAAVFKYLTAQSKDLPSYATSPVWSVVDGPWQLKSFSSDGHVTMVPNTKYSGPVKPSIKEFIEVPFTTDAAEFNVLHAASTIDVGYIPTQDISQPKAPNTPATEPGPNPLSANYTLAPWFLYGVNYFPINFNNPTVGPILKQLYFRQALQSVYDQQSIITSTAKGYGVETTGPIPLVPENSPLISQTEKSNPYPFNMAAAKKYLTDNGWNVVAGGESTCAKPGTATGECGAGIAAGAKLAFDLPYANGNQTVATAMQSLKSNASQIGITLNLKPEPFNTVIGNTVPCSGATCTWQMGNWGGGWVYAPDYYPTGELLWQTGAGSNSGSYSNPEVDTLIGATTTESGTAVMQKYEDALAKDLPVIWSPNYTYSLTEVANGLQGVTPQNPFGSLTPEAWHY
ncbi:ABC transporter substrate-binding protein [Homoserinimonas sp. OAct 916]|uniref:ABC transporter substrate-binding protein n=1 Tax=Homoserinimonas sp. OAct 916 TaxID=2211450 RepID=UPI0018E521C3|nr:ABC transporter substrate-binding protein [Homoserinimonas sp. OAct 916]